MDTFVQNLPRQLAERGSDRTSMILILLWINTILPIVFAYVYIGNTLRQSSYAYFLCLFYIVVLCMMTMYIAVLSKRRFTSLVSDSTPISFIAAFRLWVKTITTHYKWVPFIVHSRIMQIGAIIATTIMATGIAWFVYWLYLHNLPLTPHDNRIYLVQLWDWLYYIGLCY